MTATLQLSAPAIPSNQALQIACTDANRVYRDLHMYVIALKLESDGWHIDFEFKDPDAQSGGPHYIVDATTGVISWKCYEQ